MKFSCPYCSQKIEIDEASAGQTFACPACQRSLVVPSRASVGAATGLAGSRPPARPSVGPTGGQPPMMLRRPSPPAPGLPRPPAPAAASTPPRMAAGLGFARGLSFLIILIVGGYGYAMFRFQESPQQVWRRLLETTHTSGGPAASTPSAGVVPTTAPPPSATPLVADAHVAPPVPKAATPAPDPVVWVLEHKTYQPKIVSLTVTTIFPIANEGQPPGSGSVSAGSDLRLLSIDPKKQMVSVAYDGYNHSVQNLPLTSTDLLARLQAAMARADADAKLAEARRLSATPMPAASSKPAEAPDTSEILPGQTQGLVTGGRTGGFVHPGLLHNEEDFKRMRTHVGREPWKADWEKLTANPHAALNYQARPVEVVVRGKDRAHTEPENYRLLFNDIAAAYACALRWRISGDQRYADKSVEIMNAWSSTLKVIRGSTDSELAAGIYGYEFANAGEIMRTYKGWKSEDFERFKKMMREAFLPGNKYFLEHHNNAPLNHYWANWDLCNMDSMLAIGVLCDDRALYNEAINYFKNGGGMGSIKNAVNFIYPDGLGQWQESGRDQGHTTLGVSLMGAFCEMAWKQGDDLYGYDNNRFLAGCEYIAKYNLGEDVPFQPYKNDKWLQETISSNARGLLRPAWELVYNHYAVLKGLSAPYTARMAARVRPEGGGGDYGPNSGGYDQLGYGTLTATLDPHENGSFFGVPK